MCAYLMRRRINSKGSHTDDYVLINDYHSNETATEPQHSMSLKISRSCIPKSASSSAAESSETAGKCSSC